MMDASSSQSQNQFKSVRDKSFLPQLDNTNYYKQTPSSTAVNDHEILFVGFN